MAASKDDLDELLKRSAEILHSAGAREVYVFGSATTGRLHRHSDIDLAVSGLPPETFFPSLVRLSEVFGRSVDLVDLEDDTPFTNYLKSKQGLLRRVA